MVVLDIETHERVQFVDVTGQIAREVATSGVRSGAVLVYVPHTTAAVTINENADPSVRRDLQTALERLVPADLHYSHREGNADAHVKASLIGSSVVVPVEDGSLALGTWQGIFFAEFDGPRRRRLMVRMLND
jgi:secondary thiamine-phosphate synthase enzyme